jgi:hypothetical protein
MTLLAAVAGCAAAAGGRERARAGERSVAGAGNEWRGRGEERPVAGDFGKIAAYRRCLL